MVDYINIPDQEILTKASTGDQEAFGVLYERYIGKIYNYVYYRTGNQRDAEDLTARVFLRAMRHITKYQDRGLPFSAWLYRIAHNLVANWHRDNSRKKEITLDDTVRIRYRGEHPEGTILKNEEAAYIHRLIRGLSPDRQQLIILKFVEELPNAEIGVIMGRTEGAIKSLYHRTLISLRKEYRSGSLKHNGNGRKVTDVENNHG
jgi:RNA polymerase sigma-70 factor (ECF subfamily)